MKNAPSRVQHYRQEYLMSVLSEISLGWSTVTSMRENTPPFRIVYAASKCILMATLHDVQLTFPFEHLVGKLSSVHHVA